MKKLYLKINNKQIEINEDICETIQETVYFKSIPVNAAYIIVNKHNIEFQQNICNIEHFLEYFEYTNILEQLNLSEFNDEDLITLIAIYNRPRNKELNLHHSPENNYFIINNTKELPILDFNADIYTIIK